MKELSPRPIPKYVKKIKYNNNGGEPEGFIKRGVIHELRNLHQYETGENEINHSGHKTDQQEGKMLWNIRERKIDGFFFRGPGEGGPQRRSAG